MGREETRLTNCAFGSHVVCFQQRLTHYREAFFLRSRERLAGRGIQFDLVRGKPAVVTRLHGVEDYAVDGVNAWIVEREVEAICGAIQRALSDPAQLASTAQAATEAAKSFDTAGFVGRWRQFLDKCLT